MKKILAWFFASLICAGAAAADLQRFDLQWDAGSETMAVDLCLANPYDSIELFADSVSAKRFLHELKRSSGDELADTEQGWAAAHWRAGECLNYRADLGRIADAHDADIGWRVGSDLVTTPQLWMLRAQDGDQEIGSVMVNLQLASDWEISAPWKRIISSNGSRSFRIADTPYNWSASVALGHFRERRIEWNGGTLRVAILGAVGESDQDKLIGWLQRVSQATLSAYGRMPLPDVQVLMLPSRGRGGAVGFGQSVRGQGNALQLLVDPTRPASEFNADWTAVHELSHLFHPYLGDRGSWLSEGLASYYQNVLRARAGLLTPQQAWSKLEAGFGRGRKSPGGESLVDVARGMHRNHDFMRVYWAGAAYWLAVDVQLRASSANRLSVDEALRRFGECCLPSYDAWSPDDFVARLDALLDTEVFVRRFREYGQMTQFPDTRKLYEQLGLHAQSDTVQLLPDAPQRTVRNAIMSAKPPSKPQKSNVAH
jgi:M61 glycyl aminopeptidase